MHLPREAFYSAAVGLRNDEEAGLGGDLFVRWIKLLPQHLQNREILSLDKHRNLHVGCSRNIVVAIYLADKLNCTEEETIKNVNYAVGDKPRSVKCLLETIDVLVQYGYSRENVI